MIIVKKCDFQDLKDLQKISHKTFNDTFAHLNTAANMRKYLENSFSYDKLHSEMLNEASSFYFIYLDDELAGYLKLNEHAAQTDLNDPQSMEIERIYVLSDFQGKGLGVGLMDKAIEIATQRNRTYIWLGVWEKNDKAIQFYKRSGFFEISRHQFFIGDEEQIDYIMKKEL